MVIRTFDFPKDKWEKFKLLVPRNISTESAVIQVINAVSDGKIKFKFI